MKKPNISRRTFLKGTAIAGGGLVIGFSLYGRDSAKLPFAVEKDAYAANAFLQITSANDIIFYCPRDEMGQGVTTGLTTLMAEELDVSPQRFSVQFAPVHEAYNNPALSTQSTGGSTSIKVHYLPLRQVAANMRSVLIDAAVADLNVARDAIQTADAHILVAGKKHPYGRFVRTAQSLSMPESAPLKTKADFKYIGQASPRLDALEKSTGTAVYGIDVDIPNMQYALVSRCKVVGGSMHSFDAKATRAMPGVTDVVSISSGIAVVADSFWQAKKAVEKLNIQWQLPPEMATLNSKKIKAKYKLKLDSDEGQSSEKRGDLEDAFAGAAHEIKAEYWAPYLAHAPLEPMNAVVHIQDGKVDLWTGTQAPGLASAMIARRLGISEKNVHIHNAYMGGGFGRRSFFATHIDEVIEIAVQVAKPIKLIWTREDDIRHSAYRPASLMSIKASINDAGLITGWQVKRVGGNAAAKSMGGLLADKFSSRLPQGMVNVAGSAADGLMANWMTDPTSTEGLFEDYDFPNREVIHATVDDGLPLTFWRSVGHSFTAFAKESALDELAQAGGHDGVKLRLQNAKNNPRLQGVIRAVASRMGELGLAADRFVGLAAHNSFGSYVAEAAEVSVRDGKIKVHKVICAVDCGQIVNPDIVKTQMEGAIMFGLTAALHGSIDVQKGAVLQSNFHDYPILRMDEAPDVEVLLIDSDEPPSGVGEPGLPPIAPAVANAVYAATGQRLRSLPLRIA